MVAEETHLVDGEVYPRMINVSLEAFVYKELNNTILSYN
jgi:hypothetical protein